MRKTKITAVMLTVLLLIIAKAPETSAASVKVSIPPFTVTLNGMVMNNAYRQYPLIIYNNITYFPMTSIDCIYFEYSGLDGIFPEDVITTTTTAGSREVILPVVRHEYGTGKVTQSGNYYYYEGAEGTIYQAAVAYSDVIEELEASFPLSVGKLNF